MEPYTLVPTLSKLEVLSTVTKKSIRKGRGHPFASWTL